MRGDRPEFHVFLPQMRMGLDVLVDKARAAEAAGFGGIALMDHLAPPMAEDQPMHEAMITAAWLAAHTETLRVGHLVLCDSLRHPAVLAKQAVTIDHASGGRFELGIGWGSVPDELDAFGVGDTAPSARVRRLAESLEVMTALWSGESVDFEGEFHRVKGGRQQPAPLRKIPLLIGGAGRRTLALVARYADWWNLPIYALERLEELRPAAGDARVSIQQLVAFVADEAGRARVTELAQRRFGVYGGGLIIGDAAQLVDHFTALHDRGVERFYTWFSDFADPETLAAFGAGVIETLAPHGGARP
ncbi:MAG TPA: LLM class flavin-dependent oxidoreductase [Acidimicrobiales bacterium]|nr:LLM class flavin-dependent oxidoreductase [Acidimicrobiales bacterium]